ncbi:hypothetical protein SISSUDRAFT_992852 [Sistotremastrum suecicum HHB10207 ss-3]|uniref:Uncharacterized protein n=1 Tax=Sistotremastrum suecicum HHB10207 ss-3 TaxID=1314776 RepID=A0A165YUT4_9AGAM|nr:hypothetical protein SISSUDRAFT_992852 [Sistotremastrum suecicum HHB10207 ss-3]
MLAWRSRISNLLLRVRQKDQYELVVSNGHGHDDAELGEYPLEYPNHGGVISSARRRRAGSLAGSGTRALIWWTLRKLPAILGAVFAFLAFGVLWNGGVPPLFSEYYELEKSLGQHNLSLPFPEGKNGRFVRFTNRVTGHGLNNILQETLALSHLAYASRRGYVFETYTWSHTPFPYTIYDFALRPARLPLNAFISGPSAGGPLPSSSNAPRAISSEWWEVVCPPERRAFVDVESVMGDIRGEEASVIMKRWIEVLGGMTESCVEIDEHQPPLFDIFLFNSHRIISLWHSLQSSPIMSLFSWSPLVRYTVSRNIHNIIPSPSIEASSSSVIPGLVAAHIRRGDYKGHCPRLANWGATYMGFNQFDSLPDKFVVPPYTSFHSRHDYFQDHCWPSLVQIVSKLNTVRKEWKAKSGGELKWVFVLTNGGRGFVEELRRMLIEDGWEGVKSSLDLELDSHAKYVSMAVDMSIVQRAEVFVGNGFSSLTSNAVTLRMEEGLDPATNRFWRRTIPENDPHSGSNSTHFLPQS